MLSNVEEHFSVPVDPKPTPAITMGAANTAATAPVERRKFELKEQL